MTEVDRLVDELTRAMTGDPWHGSPADAILHGGTAGRPRRSPPHAHSIWEILRHMTAWTSEVHRRIDGHPPAQPLEGDWPAPSGDDEAAWNRDVAALTDAHDRLLQRVAG